MKNGPDKFILSEKLIYQIDFWMNGEQINKKNNFKLYLDPTGQVIAEKKISHEK